MNKYTKGPWKYNKSYCQQGKKPLTICDDDGMPVAGISGSSLHQLDQEANARLIAAAPELFEALIGVIDCAACIDISQKPCGNDGLCNRAVAAQELIDKVRGE